MHNILDIFNNRVLVCAVVSWFAAQGIKVLIYSLMEHKFDWRRFFGSGGMPSSHTSFVISLSTMIGASIGFDTIEYALGFALMAVVMYDATGVRRETGTQAAVINRIIKDVLIDGKRITDKELKELVGHTPLEVFAGALLGLAICGLFLL